jgi:hypothetical protein
LLAIRYIVEVQCVLRLVYYFFNGYAHCDCVLIIYDFGPVSHLGGGERKCAPRCLAFLEQEETVVDIRG